MDISSKDFFSDFILELIVEIIEIVLPMLQKQSDKYDLLDVDLTITLTIFKLNIG